MNEVGTRLEHAEGRVDQAQAILTALDRTLLAAERAQSAAEHVGSAVRSVKVVMLASVVALAAIGFGLQRRSQHDAAPT